MPVPWLSIVGHPAHEEREDGGPGLDVGLVRWYTTPTTVSQRRGARLVDRFIARCPSRDLPVTVRDPLPRWCQKVGRQRLLLGYIAWGITSQGLPRVSVRIEQLNDATVPSARWRSNVWVRDREVQ